jgi:hypothetical protein
MKANLRKIKFEEIVKDLRQGKKVTELNPDELIILHDEIEWHEVRSARVIFDSRHPGYCKDANDIRNYSINHLVAISAEDKVIASKYFNICEKIYSKMHPMAQKYIK